MSNYKIYDSCDTLTMSRFIKCLCNEDYKQLLIEGEAPIDELRDKFYTIRMQYVGLLESKDSKYIMNLMQSIWCNESKHQEITKLIEILTLCYNAPPPGNTNEVIADTVKELRSYGYRDPLNINHKQQFATSLKLITSKSKNLLTAATRDKVELKAMQDKAGNKEIELHDFTAQQIALSKYMGYRVDFEITTVTEYCYMLRYYLAYVEVKHATENNYLKKA